MTWLDSFASSIVLITASVGTAAIYTDHVTLAHFIRRAILRQIAIINYVNPF
jgi:hypothetical protein